MDTRQKKSKHYTKPAIKKLLRLCTNPAFKQRVNQIRRRWEITTLARSFDEANEFWQTLCEADSAKPSYHEKYAEGKTQAQKFQQALQELCQNPDFELPRDSNMWLVMFQIVLCFDLDNVKEEDILTLPLPRHLSRAYVVPMYNRLYLDVTFATRKDDVPEVWEAVEYWQRQIRPVYIKRGLLADLTREIKSGRPSKLTDEECREAAKLKDEEKWTYPQIGQHFGWRLQKSGYAKHGFTETRSRCRRAEVAVKRGRELRQ